MPLSGAFGTTVFRDRPTDGNLGGADADNTAETKTVSDFITVQSFTNFSAMTGGITAAWGGARELGDLFDGKWLPFGLCMAFGLISVISSMPGREFPKFAPALLIALINSLTLFGAVVATAGAAANVG